MQERERRSRRIRLHEGRPPSHSLRAERVRWIYPYPEPSFRVLNGDNEQVLELSELLNADAQWRAQHRLKDIDTHCLAEFRKHWDCLENRNHQMWQCRPAEWKLNKCVYDKLVSRAVNLSSATLKRNSEALRRLSYCVFANIDGRRIWRKRSPTSPPMLRPCICGHIRFLLIGALVPVMASLLLRDSLRRSNRGGLGMVKEPARRHYVYLNPIERSTVWSGAVCPRFLVMQ